ncbi:MAG: protein BatD [Bacteroidales bacterium]|nr:protein BatD [Bacteroidales bacterium]
MNLKLLTSATIILLCTGLLTGQDKIFTASAPAVVKAGEQFQYVIEGSEQGVLLLPPLNGFQLLAGPFSSYSSHSQWVNGKMTMKTVVTYTHVLRATAKGSFTIPPATIKVGRKEYKTNKVQIVVNEGTAVAPLPGSNQPADAGSPAVAEASDENPVFLRVIPSRRDVYVGEQFVSGLKVYTRVNTRPSSSAKDIPYEGFYKKTVDPDANAQQQDIGGQQYITQVIQRHILIPQKSGEIVIGPYESEWMVQQRVQRRSSNNIFDNFFDDPFFNGIQDVPMKLATKPVTIVVRPLPPNAPAGFTGGVGDYSLNASLSAGEIEVNEALSLIITIRGTGNLPLLGEPEVSLPPDHDLYDITRSVNTNTSGNLINGSVTFEYPIVARHAGRFRIAPVQFTWFDPGSKQYRTSTTEEFTFTVLKGESEEGQGSVYVPGVMHESVEDIGTDIRDIIRIPQVFTPLASSLFAKTWYKSLYPLSALMGILTLILIRLGARRNADLKLVRNRQANRSARVRLKKADRCRKAEDRDGFYEEVGKAIWGYLADKLNIETSGLSRDVIIQELDQREISEEVRTAFLRILDESEFSRFAPSSEKSEVNQLYKDAVTLIRNLENSL